MMSGNSVAVSSLTGDGMEDFVATVEESLMGLLLPIEVEIPYSNGKEVNLVQEVGHVESIEFRETGTYILARVPAAVANRLKPYYVNPNATENSEQNSAKDLDSDGEEIDWVALGRGRHTAKKM
uniref:HflX C-terminal domain-containing protein n=1 Tax=Eucampia antarctica TaxID=49252 RepID=A0A7S2S322_9STRA